MRQGPKHPEIVSFTLSASPCSSHAAINESTGTSLLPFSIRPQQQPLQTITLAEIRPPLMSINQCLNSDVLANEVIIIDRNPNIGFLIILNFDSIRISLVPAFQNLT